MAQPYPTPTGGEPEGPRNSGLKAAALVVCVLVLIAASVYAVNGGTDGAAARAAWSAQWSLPVPSPDGAAEADSRGAAAEPAEVRGMERTEGGPEGQIELLPAGGEELSLRELYRACIDSIVGVKVYRENVNGYVWGSGIVMSADGYILTNQHMVEDAVRAAVVLGDGRELEAKLVGEDAQSDLAVLKVAAAGLTPAEFGDSEALAVGDPVAAIGNPLGSALSGTMTDGIISAINRDFMMNGRSMTLLQTNAALNKGSSGGALVNMYGQIVGVTFMKLSTSTSVTIEGIGFAIPSSTVKAVTDAMLTGGAAARPRLGLTLGAVTQAQREAGLPAGLYIYEVAENSDAFAQGIRVGDVLTHMDGAAVYDSADVLSRRDAHAVGDAVTLTLWRDGAAFDVEIRLVDLTDIS